MFCPYCGSKKTDGVAVCPVCGGVDQSGPQVYDDSEDATRLIQSDELRASVQIPNQNMNPGMQWQQNVQQQNVQQQNMQWQQNNPQGMPVPQNNRQPEKSKTGLIIGIIVIAIVLLGGVVAFLLLRGGGSVSAEDEEYYDSKNAKRDDVCAAETLNSACNAALANEDSYDEISDVINNAGSEGEAVATAKEGEPFKSTGASGVKNNAQTFVNEVNSCCMGESPKIKYKKDGANYWTIGVNDVGKPVVWLGKSEGSTEWELQPNICDEYK